MNDKDAIWNAFITEQPIPPKPAKLKTGQPPTPPVPTKPKAQPDPGIQPAQQGQYGWNTPKTHKPPTPTPAPAPLPSPEEMQIMPGHPGAVEDEVVSGRPSGMSDADFRRQYTRVSW